MSLPNKIPSTAVVSNWEPLPNLNSWDAPLIVTELLPVPEVNLPSSISKPPMLPASAVIVPLIVTLPSGVTWKLEELISICSPEPLINCEVVLPTKKASACTSNTDGLVLNFNEPLAPTNSNPTPL